MLPNPPLGEEQCLLCSWKREKSQGSCTYWGLGDTSSPPASTPVRDGDVHRSPRKALWEPNSTGRMHTLSQDQHQIIVGNNDTLPRASLIGLFELLFFVPSLLFLFSSWWLLVCVNSKLHTRAHTASPHPSESSAFLAFISFRDSYVVVFTLFLAKWTAPLANTTLRKSQYSFFFNHMKSKLPEMYLSSPVSHSQLAALPCSSPWSWCPGGDVLWASGVTSSNLPPLVPAPTSESPTTTRHY